MSDFTLCHIAARSSAKRGSAKRAVVYVIEGDYVTADALAARLGVEKRIALRRLERERARPGRITWEGLAR